MRSYRLGTVELDCQNNHHNLLEILHLFLSLKHLFKLLNMLELMIFVCFQ